MLPARRSHMERYKQQRAQQPVTVRNIMDLSVHGSNPITRNAVSKRPQGKPRPRSGIVRPVTYRKPKGRAYDTARTSHMGPHSGEEQEVSGDKNLFLNYMKSLSMKSTNPVKNIRPKSASILRTKKNDFTRATNPDKTNVNVRKAHSRKRPTIHRHKSDGGSMATDATSMQGDANHGRQFLAFTSKQRNGNSPSLENPLLDPASKQKSVPVENLEGRKLFQPPVSAVALSLGTDECHSAPATARESAATDIHTFTNHIFQDELSTNRVVTKKGAFLDSPPPRLPAAEKAAPATPTSLGNMEENEEYHKCIVNGVFSETIPGASSFPQCMASPMSAWGKDDDADTLLFRRRDVVSIDHTVAVGKCYRKHKGKLQAWRKKKAKKKGTKAASKAKLSSVPEDSTVLAETTDAVNSKLEKQSKKKNRRTALQNVQNVEHIPRTSPSAKARTALLNVARTPKTKNSH